MAEKVVRIASVASVFPDREANALQVGLVASDGQSYRLDIPEALLGVLVMREAQRKRRAEEATGVRQKKPQKRGWKFSDEARAKISAARKAYFARAREAG